MSYIAKEYAQAIKADDVIIHDGRVYTVQVAGETKDNWVKLVLVPAGFKPTLTIEVYPLSIFEKLVVVGV